MQKTEGSKAFVNTALIFPEGPECWKKTRVRFLMQIQSGWKTNQTNIIYFRASAKTSSERAKTGIATRLIEISRPVFPEASCGGVSPGIQIRENVSGLLFVPSALRFFNICFVCCSSGFSITVRLRSA